MTENRVSGNETLKRMMSQKQYYMKRRRRSATLSCEQERSKSMDPAARLPVEPRNPNANSCWPRAPTMSTKSWSWSLQYFSIYRVNSESVTHPHTHTHGTARYYTVSQKRDTILLSTISPNINRFSKLFHYQAQQEICDKEIIKDSTTPQMRRYTALWNMNVDKYKQSQTMQLINDKF